LIILKRPPGPRQIAYQLAPNDFIHYGKRIAVSLASALQRVDLLHPRRRAGGGAAQRVRQVLGAASFTAFPVTLN
jgi:hypothetical protein